MGCISVESERLSYRPGEVLGSEMALYIIFLTAYGLGDLSGADIHRESGHEVGGGRQRHRGGEQG